MTSHLEEAPKSAYRKLRRWLDYSGVALAPKSPENLTPYQEAQVAADELIDSLASLRERVKRQRALLAELEWSDHEGGHQICPMCFQFMVSGHLPSCALARELKEEP